MTSRSRTNTPTEQNKEDNTLVIYRLGEVEKAVKALDGKISAQNSPTKQDYIELRDTILFRINEIRDGLQKQIDQKADKNTVEDLKTLIKAFASIFGSIIVGLVIFYLTKGK